jgi:hypothetical protein
VGAMVLEPLANALTAVAFVGDEFSWPLAMAQALPLRTPMYHRFKGAALMLLTGWMPMAMGMPCPSMIGSILVPKPPRERPNAWSGGSRRCVRSLPINRALVR